MNGGNPGDDALREPAHWRFWGTLLWGAVIAAVFTVLQVVVFFVVVALRNRGVSGPDYGRALESAVNDGTIISLATFATTVVCCALIAGIIKLKKHSVLKDYLAIRPVARGTMLRWLGLLACFAIVSDLITTLLGRPVVPSFMSSAYATANPIWLIWVALVVAAPLFEETFFRGFLFKGFESSFMGAVGAILVTAALWAMIHIQYDLLDILAIFCMGLLLGAARAYTGSLLVPLAMHSAGNLLATVEAAVLAGP
jgi:membrane protease YdiL (CAAX protease family)